MTTAIHGEACMTAIKLKTANDSIFEVLIILHFSEITKQKLKKFNQLLEFAGWVRVNLVIWIVNFANHLSKNEMTSIIKKDIEEAKNSSEIAGIYPYIQIKKKLSNL